MQRVNRYGVRSLERDFPTEEACLNFLFDAQHSRQCSCGGTYKLRAGRKQFQCSKCRFHIAPTAGTIFHKSDTPLTLWFKAILAFSNAKSSISAAELERQLEVTYKCAWRILNRIRKALAQDNKKLEGIVEMDTGFFGGRGTKQQVVDKTIVMAAIARGGKARASVVESTGGGIHRDFLKANVEQGSILMTDRVRVAMPGYERHSVEHSKAEYVRGPFHVNTVESFFGHIKRSIKGTHKVVSKKYLQNYLDAFVFHYNNRYSDKERFGVLLGAVLHGAR